MTGTLFEVGGSTPHYDAIKVPQADGRMRFWRNTSIANLAPGQVATLPTGTLGYEWDADVDNGFRPAGLVPLSTTTVATTTYQNYNNGIATHHLSLYRASSGALVFGAGTVQWPWGLDSHHDNPVYPVDPNMQQATLNLLADMGVQPATLQSGMVPATASTDTAPPRSTITSPASGSRVTPGSSVTVSGTAVDFGGGVVGAVEVSVDGGTTWHPAVGRENWSYSFISGSADMNVQSRAVDDSGNLEVPGPGITLTTGGFSCSQFAGLAQVWPNTAVPAVADVGPDSPVELGVTFRADMDGCIKGIRFYKSAANTGTHVGNLWSSTGALLASATFTNETASGWQQVNFSSPVAIVANTLYVASYHTNGHFSVTNDYFATSGVDNGPLHAPANSSATANGPYRYGGTSTFPTQTYRSSNYWVDVVFAFKAGPAPLSVSTNSLPGGDVNLAYSAALAASGGTTPVSWSITVGALPTGLTLNAATGEISGTPTKAGAFNFTVQAADSSTPAQNASKTLSITVNAPLTVTTTTLPNATQGTAYNTSLASSGGTGAIAWNIIVGSLPAGLSLNAPTGAITGTPPGNPGTSNFTVQATDSLGQTATKVLSITIDPTPLAFATTSLLNGAVGTAYSQTLQATGGTKPYTWSITAGTLPAGLSLSPGTGAITGTPTTAGSSNFTVQVSDSSSPVQTATRPLSITITAPAGGCPCTIWPNTAVPSVLDVGPDAPVELGVSFRSDVNGYITGIRFYKGPNNTGPHVGNLWSSTGALLASATFTNETASGWQQVNFSSPVTIVANTLYVASYHTNGHFSVTNDYFATSGMDNGPLHAPANSSATPNGPYKYGSASAFPQNTYRSSNYWVDVVFK